MMLIQPRKDCRPRLTLIRALWCAIIVLCWLVPAVLFAGDSFFQGKGPIASAVLAVATVLGAGLTGSQSLVHRSKPTAEPGIVAPGRFTAVSLPPVRRLVPDGPESCCEEACGLLVATEGHRPWTFADALIEWTDIGTSNAPRDLPPCVPRETG